LLESGGFHYPSLPTCTVICQVSYCPTKGVRILSCRGRRLPWCPGCLCCYAR
jgi:hypothetical protein